MTEKYVGVDIREAAAADLAAASTLAARFYAEEGFVTGPDEIRTHASVLIASPAALVMLADLRGRPAGLAITTTSYGLEHGSIAELEDLYVIPEARNRGCARELIRRSREWAADRGCSQLEVVIDPGGDQRHGLHGFYARLGFVDDGRRLVSAPLAARQSSSHSRAPNRP